MPESTLVDQVIARLKDRVHDLAGRVEGAAHLAQMQAQNQLPPVTPAANVLSAGLQGGSADASTGAFLQMTVETVAVILTFRNAAGKGARALDKLEEVKASVIAAIVGWDPGAVGVFTLSRGGIVSFTAGTLVYSIEFALRDQLRIVT